MMTNHPLFTTITEGCKLILAEWKHLQNHDGSTVTEMLTGGSRFLFLRLKMRPIALPDIHDE